MVNETSSGSAVQKCIDRVKFASIGCTEFHSKDWGCSIYIKGIGRELFRQLFFPLQFLGYRVAGQNRGVCIFGFTVTYIIIFYLKYSKPIYWE